MILKERRIQNLTEDNFILCFFLLILRKSLTKALIMKHISTNLAFLLLLFLPVIGFTQHDKEALLGSIQTNDLLSYGGCDLITFNKQSMLIGVSAVEVGAKKMSSLMRVGKVKAERELVTFINGSDISSSTKSYYSEEFTTINDSSNLKTVEIFVDNIREDAEGFVKGMRPAGYWFSEDKSVFYYALYKEINLK